MSQTYHIMHKLVNWESQTVHQIPSIQYQHPGGDGAGSGKQVVWDESIYIYIYIHHPCVFLESMCVLVTKRIPALELPLPTSRFPRSHLRYPDIVFSLDSRALEFLNLLPPQKPRLAGKPPALPPPLNPPVCPKKRPCRSEVPK